jgi:hypothetical protein
VKKYHFMVAKRTCTIHRNFRVVRVLDLLLDRNQRRTQAAKVREVLFVQKRKERLHGVIQWDLETNDPMGQVGNWVL